ncbi:MAG: heterodisulfide reductase-related iron-sulfur binding cluster [Syntrophales bacterium]|jgi:Fe-S oxidoreductase
MFYQEKCNLCGKCLEFCPYVEYDLNRAQDEMKELVSGGTPPIVGLCVTCASCNLVCPTQANPFDLLNQRQEETGALGIPEQAMQNFAKLYNLPTVVKKGKEGEPVLNLCIVGDMVRELLDNPLFDDLTIVEGADYFCTVGYIHLGKPSSVKKEAKSFIENLAALGAKEVICFHDDCYTMLTTLAQEYGLKVPFHPVHIFEYLYRELKKREGLLKAVPIRVAYQSPCASRYTQGKDIYLDKIFELLGVERPARKYERMSALCCGAPLMARDKERAAIVKKWNIDDAKKVKADAMVFLCPMCYLNLRKLCKDDSINPIFITELCKKALQ